MLLARGMGVRLVAWCLLLLAMDNLQTKSSRSSLAAAMQDDEQSCTAGGTCELDLKQLIAAGKKLASEAEALVGKPDEAMGISELSRVWRLVRNQQNLVHEAFQNLNTKFSTTIRSASGIVTIRTDVASDLTDLFYGGEPFIVQCVSPTDNVNRVFIEAAKDLSTAGVTPAALDCNAQLPSGKTTIERFFEGKKYEEPFFFYAANRMKPRSFTLKPHVTPEMLVTFSVNATTPKFTKVSSQDDLREDCLKRKMCAVVVHNNSLSADERAVAESVLLRKRSVAMVEVDLSKLSFSLEEALPPAKSIPRLVYLQASGEKDKKDKPKYEGKAYKGEEWTVKGLAGFLGDVQSGATKLSRLKTSPSVSERRAGKDKEKKKDKEKPARKEDRPPAKATKTKPGEGGFKNKVEVDKQGKQRKSFGEQRAVSREERARLEAEERERERRRREEMAREAESADGIEFVGEDPDEEEGRRLEDYDEYEEEHIEVDEDDDGEGRGRESEEVEEEEDEEEAIQAKKDADGGPSREKKKEGWLW